MIAIDTPLGTFLIRANRPEVALRIVDQIGTRGAESPTSPVLSTETTCLRYYNEVTNTEPCPCGCFVPEEV